MASTVRGAGRARDPGYRVTDRLYLWLLTDPGRLEQADSTLENALSMCEQFALRRDQAMREVRRVLAPIARWKDHFRACGVSRGDVAALAEQIDRPFLLEQRRELQPRAIRSRVRREV